MTIAFLAAGFYSTDHLSTAIYGHNKLSRVANSLPAETPGTVKLAVYRPDPTNTSNYRIQFHIIHISFIHAYFDH